MQHNKMEIRNNPELYSNIGSSNAWSVAAAQHDKYLREQIDFSKITEVEVEGINTKDYPDFVDAFISFCLYKGVPATESELDLINEDSDFRYDCTMAKLF